LYKDEQIIISKRVLVIFALILLLLTALATSALVIGISDSGTCMCDPIVNDKPRQCLCVAVYDDNNDDSYTYDEARYDHDDYELNAYDEPPDDDSEARVPERRHVIIREEVVQRIWVCRAQYSQRESDTPENNNPENNTPENNPENTTPENNDPCTSEQPCDACCRPGFRCGECDICRPIALPDGEVIYIAEGIRFDEVFAEYIAIRSELEHLSFVYAPVIYTGAQLCADGLPLFVGEYAVTAMWTSPYEDIGGGYTQAILFVSPAELHISGLAIDDREFNALVNAYFDKYSIELAGILGDDDVSIAEYGIAEFERAGVGSDILVLLSSFTLGGVHAHNYVLVQPETAYGNILPTPVSLVVELEDKVFSGTPYIRIDNVSKVGYFEDFEDFGLELDFTDVARLTSPEISDNVGVYFEDFALVGYDALNFRLYQPHQRGRVLGAGIDITIGSEDDSECICFDSEYEYVELYCDCENCICAYDGEYDDRVLGYVSKRQLPITISIELAEKIFNRDVDVEVVSYNLSGLVCGFDDVYIGASVIASNAMLYDFRVANDVSVLFDYLMLHGDHAHNYVLIQPENYALDIEPVVLVASGIVPQDRAYNGNRAVAFDFDNIYLTGIVPENHRGSSDVSIGGAPRLTFAHANVGADIPVALIGVALAGADAGNYVFVPPTDLTGSITPAEGTLPILGFPWLRETLSYGDASVPLYDINGEYLSTRTFYADMLGDWSHQWTAHGEAIEGANDATYIVSALDRTEHGNGTMGAQIGLTLLSDCGNFILRQENHTDSVPFDVRLEFAPYPAKRSIDNAVLSSGHADGNGTGAAFRRQLSGGTVTINNALSDGGMGFDVGASRADFSIGGKEIGVLTARGFGSITYTVNPEDAINGVITIRATYTHRGVSLEGVTAFGYQACMQSLPWQTIVVTNIGNTATGAISLSILGGDNDAFMIEGAPPMGGMGAYGEQTVVKVRPSPDNLANEAVGTQTNPTPTATNTLLTSNLTLQIPDMYISEELSVTVRHGMQTGFAVYGDNCRTTCTIAGCGRVVRRHQSAITEWATDGSYHVRYCEVPECNMTHKHAINWSEYHDLMPTQLQHGKSCTYADCTKEHWEYHMLTRSQWGVSNPAQHHQATCTTCNLSFSLPHTGMVWTRTNVTNEVCERRNCTSCGRSETANHQWGGTRDVWESVQTQWGFTSNNIDTNICEIGLSALSAIPLHNRLHVCNVCNMQQPGTGTTTAPHSLGEWSAWRAAGDGSGCARDMWCRLPNCNLRFTQNFPGGHTFDSNGLCIRCNSPVQCQLRTPAIGHNWTEWEIQRGPGADSCRERRSCTTCRRQEFRNTAQHSFSNYIGNGRIACSRCGTCNPASAGQVYMPNAHVNNSVWVNNGINERRAGRCASPGCIANAPVEYRPHTWSLEWSRNAAQHWQYCTTCPANNRARTTPEYHDFGDWFFFGQTDDICQRRFETCICGHPNPETTRGHVIGADGYCTRPGCSWGR